MIGLVVSDIDGTLVRQDKSLADATVAAAGRLAAAGIAMTLISARPPSGIGWLGKRLGLDGPFGAFNGGTLFKADGTILEQHRIPADVARRVLAHLEAAKLIRWLFADGAWLATEWDDVHCPREVKSANVDPVIAADFGDRSARADKIVAVSDDTGLLDRIEDEVRALVGDTATVARSQTYYLDITAKRGNKGDGIAALARAFGVPLAQTAAFGDQANDLPMFAQAGLSVAMGQGPDKVRAAASHVAKANDDDGVADAIDRFVLTEGTRP